MFQEMKEKKLIKAASNGDVKAYETLISTYEQKIYSICLRLLKDPEEAYDAAQEVCLKIWRQLGQFKGESKLSTWIYRLTTNQCLDILRKNKHRQNEVPLYKEDDMGQEVHAKEDENQWEDLSDLMAKQELGEVMRTAMDALKENYKVIIVLRDLEGYSYEEIAQILDISLGTVKSRLARARMALKNILEQDKEPYRSFFRHNKEQGV